jgi:hypothetical protein
MNNLDCSFYPPIFPRWCFSFEGYLTNKGTTKVLYSKIDKELLLHQQHWPKQGLFLRMAPFNSLNADQIGDQSLLQNLIKITAPCWTHCMNQYPPLANQAWKQWRSSEQNETNMDNIPLTLPKGWRTNPMICNNIIRACSFCRTPARICNRIGNLEHIHLYCPSSFLQRARPHCNQKIEDAIYNLYNYTSLR